MEQSIKRIVEYVLDRRLEAMNQPNKRDIRGEEIRTRLTAEAMNALACNRISQTESQHQLTASTTQSNSSRPG